MKVREVPAATSLPSSARDLAIRGGLETAGVIFIDEEGSAGPGVRLRKPHYNFRQIERRLPVRLLDPA
jgi:hypothetical protein